MSCQSLRLTFRLECISYFSVKKGKFANVEGCNASPQNKTSAIMKAQKEAALCNELRREMKGTEGFTEHFTSVQCTALLLFLFWISIKKQKS